MAKMTQSQRAQHARLVAAQDSARGAVYAAADRSDVPFAACLRLADDETRDAFLAADSALESFVFRMIRERRARFVASCLFTPNDN